MLIYYEFYFTMATYIYLNLNFVGNKKPEVWYIFQFLYLNAVIAPATNNTISGCLNLKRPKLPIEYSMATLITINPMPIELVLFLKRNMDMIAKTLANKIDSDI